MKKKIISVSPISKIAKDRFIHRMNSFHSCFVDKENENNYYLSSLNNEYHFILEKSGSEHWKICK